MPSEKLANVEDAPRSAASIPPAPASGPPSAGNLGQFRNFALATACLALAFGKPLYSLVQFAARSDLYSYILLIPFVSAYLVWLKKHELLRASRPIRLLAVFPGSIGLAALACYAWAVHGGTSPVEADGLALAIFSFFSLLTGAACLFLGRELLRAFVFPISFLIFVVPIPGFLMDGIEIFLQHGSAAVAHALFTLSGTPFAREGLVFQLPGIPIRVAPECSGIHSTLILFITSLLAGHLFLRTPWKRTVLALAVIPLALIRNGLRIFTIGELCVHVGPEMINSAIHRHGGPWFFAGSLVPLFLLLFVLQKSDRTRDGTRPKNPEV
jgi:exosortase C (VPDSG-CTERM-specific)